ncbi:MAG: hypothetical protein JNK89_00710, partial [Saprospiraceae bacterium]|nr:hypothetical protein [Saprospiraceae bacterium]
MKNTCCVPILFILLAALGSSPAHAIDVGVAHAVYATPEKTYLEINIEIAAASVTFKRVDSIHLQAGVETLILIKQGEKVVTFEKYRLSSPLVGYPQDLLDVKRLFVPAGEYQLEITFQDIHDANNTQSYASPLRIDL